MIPSTSRLAGRRKLRPQPFQYPSQPISPEQNAASSCPVPLKTPRKFPLLTPRKINQSSGTSKIPLHPPIQGGHFIFPVISRVPCPPMKNTRVGSWEAYKQNTETSTQEKNGETFQERNRKATIPSLPNIFQPRQRTESRDHVDMPVASSAVAPQNPRRSPRSHAAGRESLNVVPSICLIPSTSNLALRRKLKRGMSNKLAAESSEESTKHKGIVPQEPRLLSRSKLSPNRLSYPVPQKSLQTSPRKSSILAIRKINQLSRASKTPRSAMANNNYFVYSDVGVPRPPTRKIRLGSSRRFMARKEPQRSSSSNGVTQGSFLSPADSPNRFSCPVHQKSPKKPPVRTRKSMRSPRAAKTPKSATGEDRHFVYPEIPREPRPPTTKTLVRTGTMLKEQGEIKPSNQQTVTSEKQGETPKQINSTVLSLPKISNVQPTKEDLRKKREKTLLEICNELSSQKRTV